METMNIAASSAAGAMACALGLLVSTAEAAPPEIGPVPVDVTNPVLPVEVSNADPIPVTVTSTNQGGEPFTIAPKQVALVVAGGPLAPDPSGTRYAITALTGVNPTAEPVSIYMRAVAVGGFSPDCRFVFNQQDTTDGPEIRIPANDTVHITFPQPFVTAAVTGTYVCLVANGNPSYIGVKWSAVGYKMLPN